MRAPVHLREARLGDVAPRVIVSGDPSRVDYLAGLLEGARLINAYRGLRVYTGSFKGAAYTIASHGIGAPSASIVVEELIMLGAKAIVRLGTCGSLKAEVKLGDIVIPTVAAHYSGGLYYQYMGEHACPPAAPTFDVLKELVDEASSRKARFHLGPIVSSDAFYAEDPGLARRWGERGVLAVEMECSALFTLGHMRGVKTGAILVVSDTLIDGGHATGEELREHIRESALIALNAMAKLRV
ncbi:MAG: purine-nucleoside phosphorylase [Thermoprotei archaeon]|nr:purine-nucleoside phosphorylase [Thermoprotei archaeon]